MTIYLIGGPPKCGKTTLAKLLSRKLSIPWISADTLQNIVYAYTAKKDLPKYFPHSYLKGKTNDQTYGENSSEKILQGYINQAKTSYKAISMLVETQIIDHDDYIIEGYQVSPEIVAQIIKKFGHQNIKTIFLIKQDTDKFIANIHKSTTPNDWIIRKTKEEKTFSKIAKMIAEYSNYFEKEAKKHNFPVINMDQNFENQITKAINLLIKPNLGKN